MLNNQYQHFALMATSPFLFCIALFFCLEIVGQLTCMFGPVAHYYENSKYYSAVKPCPNKEVDSKLLHITIEMPVYKESLQETITPSVYSLKKAMQTYARQGGTSTILMQDNGLQLISDTERDERIAFYADHTTSAGSPDQNTARTALFMQVVSRLLLMMEKHLAALIKAGEGNSADGTVCLEDRALEMAVEQMFNKSDCKPCPWACNDKSMHIGEIILVLNLDTIIPEDCIHDAACELAESPKIAIIQHKFNVMQVAHHYFKNGVSDFTCRVHYACKIVSRHHPPQDSVPIQHPYALNHSFGCHRYPHPSYFIVIISLRP
jgi:hypothetical protein